MDLQKSFLICGGDSRQIKLADNLAAYGYTVIAYGFNEEVIFGEKVQRINNIYEALKNIDIVVLPLPCSVDDEMINMPMYSKKLTIIELFKDISKNQIVLAGRVSSKIKKIAGMYNIYIVDYFEREELTVLNAIPTSEGAIQIAMEELPITLHGSNCLVLGFGRIGKLLSKALSGLGAITSISARKFSDHAWIKGYGYNCIPINELNQNLSRFDVIFNTIPSIVLDKENLSKVDKNALIIDLASKPGGVDFILDKENYLSLDLIILWTIFAYKYMGLTYKQDRAMLKNNPSGL